MRFYFYHLLKVIHKSCIPLLNQGEPLTYAQWNPLFKWVWSVWDGLGSTAIQEVLQRTIRRGIDDLSYTIEQFEGTPEELYVEYAQRGMLIGAWYAALQSNICPQHIKDSSVRLEILNLFFDKVACPFFVKAQVTVGLDQEIESLAGCACIENEHLRELLISDWKDKINNYMT